MMSKDTSRTSSQDTTVSLVVAKDSLMGKELQAPLHKAPVKTALHQAVTDGRIHQARLLSANVKNIDTKDVNGWTPLMLACNAKRVKAGNKMMKMFLQQGAEVNFKDMLGRTALMVACLSGNVYIVRRLLSEDGLDICAQDNDGNTALIHAAMKRNLTILNMMLSKVVGLQLTVDKRNNLGYTAMLLACKLGNFDNALALLTVGGACPYIRDMEHRYCARNWINWFRYKQHLVESERQRFPHLLNTCLVTSLEKLPEEKSIDKLLARIYKPVELKPAPLMRSLSLPVDVNLVNSRQENETHKQSMAKLRKEIKKLEDEHELEQERLSLVQIDGPSKGRQRNIATAKLRSVAADSVNTRHQKPITLPNIFTLYALHHGERCMSYVSSVLNLTTAV